MSDTKTKQKSLIKCKSLENHSKHRNARRNFQEFFLKVNTSLGNHREPCKLGPENKILSFSKNFSGSAGFSVNRCGTALFT